MPSQLLQTLQWILLQHLQNYDLILCWLLVIIMRHSDAAVNSKLEAVLFFFFSWPRAYLKLWILRVKMKLCKVVVSFHNTTFILPSCLPSGSDLVHKLSSLHIELKTEVFFFWLKWLIFWDKTQGKIGLRSSFWSVLSPGSMIEGYSFFLVEACMLSAGPSNLQVHTTASE